MTLAQMLNAAKKSTSVWGWVQTMGRWFFTFDWIQPAAGEGVVVTRNSDGVELGLDWAALRARQRSGGDAPMWLVTATGTDEVTVGLAREARADQWVARAGNQVLARGAEGTPEVIGSIAASSVIYVAIATDGTISYGKVASSGDPVIDATIAEDAGVVILALVTVSGGEITAVTQIHEGPVVWELPAAAAKSVRWVAGGDDLEHSLELENDEATPAALKFYAVSAAAAKGWTTINAAIEAWYRSLPGYESGLVQYFRHAAGDFGWVNCTTVCSDPPEVAGCGECESAGLTGCLVLDGFEEGVGYFALAGDCTGEGGGGVTPWDGKISQVSGECRWIGSGWGLEVRSVVDTVDEGTIVLKRVELRRVVIEGECYWEYTIYLLAGAGETVGWRGERAVADGEAGAYTKSSGCIDLATITLVACDGFGPATCGTLNEGGYRIAGYSAAAFACGSCPGATSEPEWDGTWPLSLSPLCGFANEHWATENVRQIDGFLLYGTGIYLETNYDGLGHDRWFVFATCGGSGSTSICTYLKYTGSTPAGDYAQDDWRGFNPGYAASCAGPSSITVEAIP